MINSIASPRFLVLFVFFLSFIVWLFVKRGEKEYSLEYRCVDAIVPAFNEEITISRTVGDLLKNKYIKNVIVVDDGSTDKTAAKVEKLQAQYPKRVKLIRQRNSGKAGAINNGLDSVTTEMVFLTDADIRIPNDNGLGYLIQAIEEGADAVAGIPGSDLTNLNFLGKVRASIKIFFATFRKCGGEILGGHPFCVSGSVGMYKTPVLRRIRFPGRTCVEDLDLTWLLISKRYKVAQSARAVVYSQEASSLGDDIRRWRRWISGYAVCMRFHRKLLLTRFGLTTILLNFLIGLFGFWFLVAALLADYKSTLNGMLFWCVLLLFASGYSAYRQQKKWWLILYSPFSVVITFNIFICWLLWGLPSLVTGKEAGWQKVKRY